MSAIASEAGLRGSLRRLPVVAATAVGATSLSAFHRALVSTGTGHFNLVRLSSVIPPGVEAVRAVAGEVVGGWGDRLYCVYAEQRTSTVGEEAWAGVGWVQRRDSGGGFFVEHEGTSEAEVEDLLRRSLEDMLSAEPHAFAEPDWVVTGIRCEEAPVCALVIVPYVTDVWTS